METAVCLQRRALGNATVTARQYPEKHLETTSGQLADLASLFDNLRLPNGALALA